MRNLTIAQQVADAFGNDGMHFGGVTGPSLDDVARNAGATVSYARIRRTDNGCEELVPVSRNDIHDRIRYAFEDGSAIVVAGDAWDIEGKTPFSWAGA